MRLARRKGDAGESGFAFERIREFQDRSEQGQIVSVASGVNGWFPCILNQGSVECGARSRCNTQLVMIRSRLLVMRGVNMMEKSLPRHLGSDAV